MFLHHLEKDIIKSCTHARCVAVQLVLKVRGRNQSSWDGIGWGHVRGHLFWGDKILKGVELKGDHADKRERKDLFYDGEGEMDSPFNMSPGQVLAWRTLVAWVMPWLTWILQPLLGLALQATTGHNYLNYHHSVTGSVSEHIC